MRVLSGYFFLGVLLAGCEARHPAATSATPRAKAAATPATRAAYQVWDGPVDAGNALPSFSNSGQRWWVRTAAVADSAHFFTFASRTATHQSPVTERGPQVTYTFQVLNDAGQPRFTTRLRKADFLGQAYGGLVAVAGAANPWFLGYWPARQALVFDVCFAREDTDDAQCVLLLLDACTGRLLHRASGQPEMGSCDCHPTLTADGQSLLAGDELLRADGRVVTLARPQLAVAATRVLNDSTFLVAYENGEMNGRAPARNAQLLNRRGQTLHRFTFHGTDAGNCAGGFSLEHEFLPATQTHYLFDNSVRAFTLILRANPAAMQQVPAARLVAFKAPRRATEVELDFSPDCGPSASLYVDTLTHQLRCTLTPSL